MIAWSIRNPVIVLAAVIALACAGAWSWMRLPVDAIPDLSDNQVIVWSEWSGKSPEPSINQNIFTFSHQHL